MKKLLTIAGFLTMAVTSSVASAGERTIKLSVPGMNCASCPYMVKQAISDVDGIRSVEATMDDRSATVIFEDTLTTIDKIVEATANIGYPSTVITDSNS